MRQFWKGLQFQLSLWVFYHFWRNFQQKLVNAIGFSKINECIEFPSNLSKIKFGRKKNEIYPKIKDVEFVKHFGNLDFQWKRSMVRFLKFD